MRPAERLYAVLLRALPRGFRREATTEMAAVFAEAYREAVASPRPRIAVARLWARALRDLLRTTRDLRNGHSALVPPSSESLRDRASMIDILMKDLRFASRSLRRSPVFTLVIIATLAVGIGANTAIFSVVDGILLRPLPFDEPHQLVAIWSDQRAIDGPPNEWLSFPGAHDLKTETDAFEEVGIWVFWGPTLVDRGEAPLQVNGALVSAGTFSRVLRTAPALGRGFLPSDDVPEAPPVALISHELWTTRFAADPELVGRTITLDEEAHTVVGVMPEGLTPPFVPRASVWRPLRMDMERHAGGRGSARFLAIGRLADGTTLESARAAADTLALRQHADYPESVPPGVGYTLTPLQDDLVGPAAVGLYLLLGAVGFVLLMACLNVANLLLAQATARGGEIAVRAALGATRRRIVRQLLSEGLLLALVGGGLGALLGVVGTRALVRLAPLGTPRITEVTVDLRVLAFAAFATIVSALLFSLLPAMRTASVDLQDALKEGGRSADRGASGRKLRSGLVVVQVAIALMLLVGAGLLLRTFQQLRAVDLGFDPEGVLTVTLNLPAARYQDGADMVSFYETLEQRLAALPGVRAVGGTNSLPLSGSDGDSSFGIEGRPAPPPGQARIAWIRRVTPGFRDTMGLRQVSGRFFTEADDREAARVVIINEALARRYFEGEDPVGQRVYFGAPSESTYRRIVGVVGDVKQLGIARDEPNAIYFPYSQVAIGFMTLTLRAEGDPESLTGAVRRVVSELDPGLATSSIATMESVVARSLATERFMTLLMGAFALVALLLAVVGLYGVVSYGVGLRRRELGVRLALGADGGDIGRLVVGGSMALVVAGLALGMAGAWMLAQLMAELLFGIAPRDPLTFGGVLAVLLVAGLVASALPARRAARVDAVAVLNQE